MSFGEDIEKARERLQTALGDKFNEYMQNLKKWFLGKTTKQEFDNESRSICTDNYIHLHNEFLLCIITKCNNFSTIVTDAANKPITNKQIYSELPKKTKKKIKTCNPNTLGSKSTLLRFVSVDSIKHSPSIQTSSLESAAQSTKDFSLEFCSRERSLPYFKMIHNRLLLGAIDYNLKNIDIKAVFLLAEATIWLLKNIITKLASRSEFKQRIRCESAHENYKINKMKCLNEINQERKKSQIVNELKLGGNDFKRAKYDDNDFIEEEENDDEDEVNTKEKKVLEDLSDDLKNPAIVPVQKLPTTLFDLKNLLQAHRSLIPSHSIYYFSMEKIICNLYHDDDEQTDLEEKD